MHSGCLPLRGAAAFFMATTHRPKITRKELKQPDEFMTAAFTVEDFVAHHLDKVLTGAIAILVLAGVLFLIYQHVNTVRREAAEQFYDAFSALNAKDYKGAEQKFDDLIAKHPSSSAASMARFYLGIAYFNAGDLDRARHALEQYTQTEAPRSLHELALMDLGVIYEQARDYDKAVKAYNRAAALNGPQSNDARVSAARVLLLEGKRDAAISAYQDFLKTNPYAPQRETVVQALANLGMSPPAAGGSPATAP